MNVILIFEKFFPCKDLLLYQTTSFFNLANFYLHFLTDYVEQNFKERVNKILYKFRHRKVKQ